MERTLKKVVFAVIFAFTATAVGVLAGPVIIDVDGSVESLVALGTVLEHPSAGGANLLLVSVTGTAWGTLTAGENNVRAFLRLAGRDEVPVAVGYSSTMGDTPDLSLLETDPTAPGGSCDDTRLFPPTPAMAAARGMPISRYDEDDAFGCADALPFPKDYGAKGKEVIAAMSSVYNQLSSSSGRVAYIATAGLSNLGRFIASGNANAVSTMTARTDVHIYENGNNLPLDSAATTLVLSRQTAGLTAVLYTPAAHAASVRFAPSSWASLKLAASSASTKAHIAWLFAALQGRKNALDGGVDGPSSPFFANSSSSAVGAAFVVMCAIDTTTATIGRGVLAATNENRKRVIYNRTVAPPQPGLTSLTLNGNKVTRGGFLQLVPLPVAVPGGGVVVVAEPPTKVTVGQLVSLLDAFWEQWRKVMLP